MSLINEITSIEVSPPRLRTFGLIVGGIAFILGGWNVLQSSISLTTYIFLGVGLFLFMGGLVLPNILTPLYRVWMSLGILLGAVVSPLILLLLFIVLIVPIGLLRKVFGDDPLKRSLKKTTVTYWIPHDTRDASHMRRPF